MSRLLLDAESTIYQAGRLLQQCRELLATSETMVLDCSRITEMDCAALQVLLWLTAEAARTGKSLVICDLSEAAKELFTLTGATSLLPIVETGGTDES